LVSFGCYCVIHVSGIHLFGSGAVVCVCVYFHFSICLVDGVTFTVESHLTQGLNSLKYIKIERERGKNKNENHKPTQ
jgi:hypothetical protein